MNNQIRYFSSLFTLTNAKFIFGKKQSIKLPDCSPEDLKINFHRHDELTLTQTYINEWKAIFKTDLDLSNIKIPFMYHWPSLIQFFVHTMLPNSGIVMKNTFHIGMEYEIFDTDFIAPGTEITHDIRMVDIVPWGTNKFFLVTTSEIKNKKTEKLVLRGKDFTVGMNIKPEEIEMIHKKGFGKDPLAFMKEGFRYRTAKFPDPQRDEFTYFMDEKLDHRYGLASGGYTLTHGIKILAKFFGRGGKPFIQAAAMTNLIILYLIAGKKVQLKNISAYFNNRLYFPGKTTLRMDDHDFELFDDNGIMVQYGRYNS